MSTSQPGPASALPTLDDAAMYGLAGDVVRQVADYTEASHVGILATFLSAAGVLMGRDRQYEISGADHRMNLNVLLVGTTSSGRKGTTVAPVERVLNAASPHYSGEHIESGLVSGAGLIERVRDPDPVDGSVKDPHPGVADQRLWVLESEFAGALRRAAREGNDLSERIREAWDSRPLSSLARGKNRLRSSSHHIAIVGHITPSELRLRATESDIAGGTLNRFLPILVERSLWLPDPEPIPAALIGQLGQRLAASASAARGGRSVRRDSEASQLWNANAYKELHPDLPDGPLAKVVGRAAPTVVRLSMIYAALDQSEQIGLDHLEAAMALWRYSYASAQTLFGDLHGADSDLVRLSTAVMAAGEDGLTLTQINDLFSGHRSADTIAVLLQQLAGLPGFVVSTEKTGGRPVVRARYVDAEKAEQAEKG